MIRHRRFQIVPLYLWIVGLVASFGGVSAADSLPVTDGLQLWLKADTGVTSDANGVSAWADQSGHGHTLVQSDNDRKPTVVASAFDNGGAALRFTDDADDALDDRLDGPALITGGEARSIFMVVRQNIGTSNDVSILALNKEDSSGDGSLYRITPELGAHMGNADALYANHPVDEEFRIVSMRNPANATSGNTLALLDGITIEASAVNSPDALLNTDSGGIRIGDSEGVGGAAFSGDIAEIIVYDRELDAAESNAVGHYLESRYGLKTSHVPEAKHTGKVQVWLMGGQSNMRGHGNPVEITDPRYQTPQGDVMFWHNQHNEAVFWDEGDPKDITGIGPQAFGFEQLTWGGGRTRYTQEGGFGPELGFGRAMADAHPDSRIALIKHSIGGSNLYSEWNPEANGGAGGEIYLDFLETTHAALQALTDAGLDYEIRGMLWMQGESDTGTNYQANIESLIRHVRQEFQVPSMAFLMGLTYHGNSGVREAQTAAAANDPYVSVVDTIAIVNTYGTVSYDSVHMNTASQLEFGRQFALTAEALPPPISPPAPITFVSAEGGASGNTFETGSTLADTDWASWGTDTQVTTTNGSRYLSVNNSNPAELTTQLTGLADGTYEIYVFFWDQISTTSSNNWTLSAKLGDGVWQSYSSPHADAVSGTTKLGVIDAASLTFTNDPSLTTYVTTIQEMFGVSIGQAVVSGGSTVNIYIDNLIDSIPMPGLTAGEHDHRSLYDGVGYRLLESFDDWIKRSEYGLDPADQGFSDDPDGDGLINGLEAWFGSHPGEQNTGLTELSTDRTTTLFHHPQNEDIPTNITGAYEWSPNLADWYGSATGAEGGPTVNFTATTNGSTTEVEAVSSEPLDRVFLRAVVTQD